ncbi:MAG: hypothetical protein KJ077_31730 [Anaerolineae bacterium]|nr:hypothetical protein [Anaerolineae bacterium]
MSPTYSPDGHYIAASIGKRLQLWEAETGQEVTGFEWNKDSNLLITFVVYSPDGRHLAVVERDGTAGIWDTNTWENTVNFNIHHDKDLIQVVYSPDGRHLATASDDTTAKIWDVTTGEKIATLFHETPVRYIGYRPDGSKIITISIGEMVAWDASMIHEGGEFVAKELSNN